MKVIRRYNMDMIERALINIFKEENRAVIDITDNTVTVGGLKEITYNYTVEGDIITITNKLGAKVYEKSIRSYQDLNVYVTMD